MSMKDGFIDFEGFKTYYQIYGDKPSSKIPLLVLHGGPGSTHHYLQNLHKLTSTGRQVIFYDQFGSGQSEGRTEKKLWKVHTFVDQVAAVRNELGLDKIHLLGHSWGGMLAIEYLLTKPKGVSSAILSSAMIDMPLYQKEVDKLVDELPVHTGKLLKQHHESGTIDSDEYKLAFEAYNKRHIFQGEQWPSEIKTPVGASNTDIYHTMWGLSEAYTKTGALKDWSVVDRLHTLQLPVLITSGEHDELTPLQAKLTQQHIKNSELVIFKGTSHCHHVEDERAFFDVISEFLIKHDR